MISYKKQKGFSLVEALMGIIVIGLVFIMMAPFVIKKVHFDKTGKNSQGFYFEHADVFDDFDEDRCYQISNVSSSGFGNSASDTLTLVPTKNCQRFEFVVPKNVHFLDLTLVAGGGGGGGAAGSSIYTTNKYGSMNKPDDDFSGYYINHLGPYPYKNNVGLIKFDFLKNIYIKYMVSEGEKGSDASTDNHTAGKGGKSGNAIVDYTLTRKIIYNILFKNPIELFVKTGPGPDCKDGNNSNKLSDGTCGSSLYNPVVKTTKTNVNDQEYTTHTINENYQRFFISDIETKSDSKKYALKFYRYGKTKYTDTSGNEIEEMCNIYMNNKDNTSEDCGLFALQVSNDSEPFAWKHHGSHNIYGQYKSTTDMEGIESSIVESVSPVGNGGNAVFDALSSGASNPLPRATYNTNMKGTDGATIKQTGEYGKGGRGDSINNYLKDDNSIGIDTAESEEKTAGKAGHDIYVSYEFAGTPGSGGVGGASITLERFPVIPGSRYTIYVGGGGVGGDSGITAEDNITEPCSRINCLTPVYSVEEVESATNLTDTEKEEMIRQINNQAIGSAGQNGTSGSSTALYDENNNLVVMVLGGVGGNRGNNRYTGFSLFHRVNLYEDPHRVLDPEINASDPLPQITPARHFPVVIIGGNYVNGANLQNIGNLPERMEINNENITIRDIHNNSLNLGTVRRIINNNFSQAIRLLNTNRSEIYTAGSNLSNVDGRTGGFSNFSRVTTSDDNFTNSIYLTARYMENTTSTNRLYNGFYARNVDGLDYMYVGGLGGFSGLGTKAGCGGGFVGNKDGLRLEPNSSDQYQSMYKDTMAFGSEVRNGTTVGSEFGNAIVYRVNDFYDNCSYNSPNGQSAKFIRPHVSLIEGVDYGQAGSGGGGGGWSTKYGSGRGGNGQNGYLFITWNK